MKKKIYLVLILLAAVALLSSCRGFKSAPPCPAYSTATSSSYSMR